MIVYLHWIDEAIKEVPTECLVKNGLSNTVIRAKIQPLFTFRFFVTVEFKMSFEQLRTALALAFADGLLNEEKFVILYNEYEPKNPTYPYWDSFCLDSLTFSECESNFRLAQEDIPVLVDYLHIPDNFVCSQGTLAVV